VSLTAAQAGKLHTDGIRGVVHERVLEAPVVEVRHGRLRTETHPTRRQEHYGVHSHQLVGERVVVVPEQVPDEAQVLEPGAERRPRSAFPSLLVEQ